MQLGMHVRTIQELPDNQRWWVFFNNVPLLVFHCHVGIYHAFSDLKPHTFITSQSLWVRSQGTAYLSPLLRVTRPQSRYPLAVFSSGVYPLPSSFRLLGEFIASLCLIESAGFLLAASLWSQKPRTVPCVMAHFTGIHDTAAEPSMTQGNSSLNLGWADPYDLLMVVTCHPLCYTVISSVTVSCQQQTTYVQRPHDITMHWKSPPA